MNDARKIQARREVDAVNAELAAGAPAVSFRGGHKTATTLASDRLGVNRMTFKNRVGEPGRPGAWERAFGAEYRPNWGGDAAPAYEAFDDPEAASEPVAPAPYRLGGSVVDRKIAGLEDEVRRLKTALKDAHRQALDDDAIRDILGVIARAPEEPPRWLIPASTYARGKTPEVPVTIWSDWHLGEVVSASETHGINAFSPDVCEARVRRLVEATISLCRNHGPAAQNGRRYPGIVINLLGDFVSGGLHPELAKTDAEESIPSCLRVRDILVWALEQMLEEFGQVYVPCTAGNHGRSTQKPEFKRYVYKNFDWLIYQMLSRHFAGNSHIRFDIPDTNEVHYRVFGQRYLAMHGDMLGVKGGDGIIGSIGPIMRGEVKVGKQSAALGRDYDVLLMGHWHQPLWLPRVIVANTLKGFDEYAKNSLRAPPSEPSQPLWFVHPRRGITSRWDVKVETQDAAESAPWVSWKNGARAAA